MVQAALKKGERGIPGRQGGTAGDAKSAASRRYGAGGVASTANYEYSAMVTVPPELPITT